MVKTIIVTGASKGIGLAITTYLLKKGHNVIAVARSHEVLADLEKKFDKQLAVVIGDMTEEGTRDKIDLLARNPLRTIDEMADALIINHGTLEPITRVEDANEEDWKKCFDVNFFSAVALIRAVLPCLRASGGKCILVSSGAARHSYTGWGAYCASKAALKSFGDTLAVEEKYVTTISVEPGTVDTAMQKDIREKHSAVMAAKDVKRFETLHSEGKLAKPEGPGCVIANLALNASADLSGKTFRWDSEEAAPYRDKGFP